MRWKGAFTIWLLLVVGVLGNPLYLDCAAEGRAVVAGRVTDNLGAVIPGTKLTFAAEGFATLATTSESGQYEVKLPPGRYSVTTEKKGFCSFRRSEFQLPASAKVAIDISLLPCGIRDSLAFDKNGKYRGEHATKVPEHEYDSFPVRGRDRAPLELLIRYGLRAEHRNTILYSSGADVAHGPVRVVVTYDLITVTAHKVALNRKKMCLCARGNVVLQDGTKTESAEALRIQFRDGETVVEKGAPCTIAP